MKLLERGPDGHFIGYGQALHVWLPVLLKRCSYDSLQTMLAGAIRYCEMEAGKELCRNGEQLESGEFREAEAEGLALWGVRSAQRWEKRRAILLKALRELREVK